MQIRFVLRLALASALMAVVAACADVTGLPIKGPTAPRPLADAGSPSCTTNTWWGHSIIFDYGSGLWLDEVTDVYFSSDPYGGCDSDATPTITDVAAWDAAYQSYYNASNTFLGNLVGLQAADPSDGNYDDSYFQSWANPDNYEGLDQNYACPQCGPPVKLPDGRNGEKNIWINNGPDSPGARDKWVPEFPIKSRGGGQASGSWDEAYQHWDVDDGAGTRRRYRDDGTEVDHNGFPVDPSPEVQNALDAAGVSGISLELLKELFAGLEDFRMLFILMD